MSGVCRRVHLNRPVHQVCSKPQITYISHVLAGICPVCQVSLAIHSVRGCPPLFFQAHVLADSLLQLHYQCLSSLPSIYNPSITIRALDSTGGDTEAH